MTFSHFWSIILLLTKSHFRNGEIYMQKIGNFVCKHKTLIIIITLLLLIPSLIGYVKTKINYDIDYVDNYSFMMDMKVIFLTMKSVILKTGVEHSKSYIHEEINELRENYLYVTKPLPFVDKRIYEKNQKSITI